MAAPAWMAFYPADYLADTGHLTTLQHGAYLLLILHYWRTGGLPDDDRQLARIARMTDREWKASADVLAGLFQEGWKHKRIDVELARADKKGGARADAGRLGGKAKAANAASKRLANATDLPQQNPTNALAFSSQSPSSSLRSEESSENLDGSQTASAVRPPVDHVQRLWDEAPTILLSLGVTEKSIRPLIGRWMRDSGNDAPGVLAAIVRARDERVFDPRAWITATLTERSNGPGHLGNPQQRPADRPKRGLDALAAVARREFAGLDQC